jgi:hypothetical protein
MLLDVHQHVVRDRQQRLRHEANEMRRQRSVTPSPAPPRLLLPVRQYLGTRLMAAGHRLAHGRQSPLGLPRSPH